MRPLPLRLASHGSLASILALTLVAGESLETDYDRQRTLRIRSEASIRMENTLFEMEIDGEPSEGFGGRGGGRGAFEEVRTMERTDAFVRRDAADEDSPLRIVRTYEEVRVETSSDSGDEDRERAGPLDGVTLTLDKDSDGDVSARVTGGEAPDDEILDGALWTLPLDELLPAGDAEPESTWELEAEAVQSALAFALDRRFFPPREREAPDADQERGERRRRGPRGGGGAEFLNGADWEGEATLASVDEGGVAVITLELSAEGDLPDPDFGGGGRRGFVTGGEAPAWGGPERRSGSFEVELEGTLLFDTKARLPISLELEGELSTERLIERDRGGRSIVIRTESDGTFRLSVKISEE